MACNQTADQWLNAAIFTGQPILDDCAWPWMYISADQFVSQAHRLHFRKYLGYVYQVGILITCAIGLCSSMCSLFAVWRKATKKRERFYIWMLIIAILDLHFSILYVPVVLAWNFLFPNVFRFSYILTDMVRVLKGAVYGLSMAADLCALALTIERFFVICKPLAPVHPRKRELTILGAFGIIIVSALRFVRNSFHAKVVTDPSNADGDNPAYIITDNPQVMQSTWFITLVYVSDIILPFLLLIFMLYLAGRICLSIIKRRHSRVHDNASTQQQLQMQKESSAILKLLFVLVAFFVLTQLGYCLYSVSVFGRRQSPASFAMSLGELSSRIDSILYGTVVGLYGYIVECISRSTSFYFYYILSGSIRREFRKFCGLSV